MPKKLIFTSVLLIICAVMVSCAKKDTKINADFASFDKAYIPALFLTNQGEKEASAKAMTILKARWTEFKNKYYESYPEDPNWKKNMDNIELMLSKADQAIEENGELANAHGNLEGVRITFMEMRKRNNIEYYIDYLTEFHEPMEGIVMTANGKKPETLTDDDIIKIQKLLEELISIWDKLKIAKFNKALFNFTDEKVKTLENSIELEYELLNNLKQALESKDKESIIKSVVEIKPNFIDIFTSFGDFETNEGNS